MEKPPPQPIDVEVVRESTGDGAATSPPPAGTRGGGPPIHPLAALLLLVIDNLWNLPEFLAVDWPVTIPLSFLTVFVPTFLIQRLLKKNSKRRALGYGFLLGLIAAVPFSVTGTPVGLTLLAWTGLSAMLGHPRGMSRPGSPPS